MPLVFVHGVNVRKDASYEVNQAARDALFRQYALSAICAKPSTSSIENPYWGQYGANPAWHMASLPDGKYQAFGQSDTIYEQILNETAWDVEVSALDKVLLSIAHVSLERAVNCLWCAAAYTDTGKPVSLALALLSAKALLYAQGHPNPSWLAGLADDSQFVEKLLTVLEAWQSESGHIEAFGVSSLWDHMKTSAQELSQRAAGLLVNPSVRVVRPWVNSKLMIFLGDVFVYLRDRDAADGGQIVNEVVAAFRRAEHAKSTDDPKLVIVGHSMGGNIAYDILSHFAPDIQVDLFLTVGSQVAMFEELKLFKASSPTIAAPSVVPPLQNVDRWINVLDLNDVLAYSTGKIFSESLDTKFDNHVPVWAAHTTYFSSPLFHQRLQLRLLENDTHEPSF
jgi:hypothetical protein